MKEKIGNIINYCLIFLLSLLILIGNIKNGIVLLLMSIIVIYFFVKKVKIKNFMLFLIIFSIITKIVCILILKTPILTDYWIMYEAAQNMLNNDYSFLNKPYFLTWGYQLFHVFYEAFVLGIFNNVIILKILNCVYSTVITVMIYLIAKKISSENAARISSLLYSITLYPLYLNSILGNQQLALMLMLIGVYILLFKQNNIKNLIIVGLLIALSNLERSEAIVYIVTILVYLFISNEKFKDIVKKSTIILFTYFIIVKGSSFILIKSGFNDIGFDNKNPYWKFITGFSYETNGKYNWNDEYLSNTSDLENSKKVAIKRIKEVKKWPKLFYEKTKIIWLYDDLEESLSSKNMNISNELNQTIINYIKLMNLIIILFVFIGLYKNKLNNESKFFMINVIIYFCVYLLIEVQIRYYINPQVSLFILSSIGIDKILKQIDKKEKSHNS